MTDDLSGMVSAGDRRINRRRFLRDASYLAVTPAILGGVATACGGSSSSSGSSGSSSVDAASLSGTVHFVNYPDWIGKGEYNAFHANYPAVTIKEVAGMVNGGDAATVAQIHSNPGAYDMVLGSVIVQELNAGGLWQAPDFSQIPNLNQVPEFFRTNFKWGIPTDYGRVGLSYRKDLISEQPSSWQDLWDLAPKYSGKITMPDFDTDVLGVALLLNGFGINSADPTELNKAKESLIEIKPHLQAFLATDYAKPLAEGSAVMAVCYDYAVSAARAKNKDIEWVIPEEGVPGYIEGWAPIKGTKLLPEVETFMNFHLEPKNYANFVNTLNIGPSILPAAVQYVHPAIANDPVLVLKPGDYDKLQNELYISPEATKLRNDIWEEVKAA
jgi:spermidine/putrescine transport system substrate-binding protein